MKKIFAVVVLAVFGILHVGASGQNLIVNGDFEAGTLAPWTVLEGSVELHSNEGDGSSAIAAAEATISQTFATTPGKRYFVSFVATDGGSHGLFEVLATPGSGGVPDGTRLIRNNFNEDGTRHSFTFEATTDSTILGIRLSPYERPGTVGGIPPAFVDDILVVQLGGSPFAGNYKGTLIKELGVPDLDVSQQISDKVIAKIDDEGRIAMIQDADDVSLGHILPNGMFAIRSNGILHHGTAAVKGKRIELLMDEGVIVKDESATLRETTIRYRYVLTRTKR